MIDLNLKLQRTYVWSTYLASISPSNPHIMYLPPSPLIPHLPLLSPPNKYSDLPTLPYPSYFTDLPINATPKPL